MLPAAADEKLGVTLESPSAQQRASWLSRASIATVLDTGLPVSVAPFNQSWRRFNPFWVTVMISWRWSGE